MELPFISVIIPVKPGGHVRALDALKKADYPAGRMEVIVAEGRQPSAQRNRAAKAAVGEILYFLDDDSLIPPGLFKEVAKRFERPEVAIVGGPILTPDTDSFLQKGFGLTLGSPFGGSSIRARYKKLGPERNATENDLILANLSFRRKVFIESGGFNERLYPNEENELMNRLQAEGHTFLYVPDAGIYRSQRTSYALFLRQVFTYGRGRMDQNYAHPEGFRPLHLAPSVFLLYCLSLLGFTSGASLLGVKSGVYFLPAIIYLSLGFVFSVIAASEGKNPLFFFLMPLLFLSLHLGYGAGFIWGAAKGVRTGGHDPVKQDGITIRKVDLGRADGP